MCAHSTRETWGMERHVGAWTSFFLFLQSSCYTNKGTSKQENNTHLGSGGLLRNLYKRPWPSSTRLTAARRFQMMQNLLIFPLLSKGREELYKMLEKYVFNIIIFSNMSWPLQSFVCIHPWTLRWSEWFQANNVCPCNRWQMKLVLEMKVWLLWCAPDWNSQVSAASLLFLKTMMRHLHLQMG